MALRPTASVAIPLAIVAAFATGVALDRYVFPANSPESGRANGSARDARGGATLIPTSEAVVLAAMPATAAPGPSPAGGSPAGIDGSRPEGQSSIETAASVTDATVALRRALQIFGFEGTERGDRAAAVLEARPDRDDQAVELLLARWLAARGRTAEAARRLLAQIGRRTPTTEEISYLSTLDPRAGVAAARTLVERRPGSPAALESLAESLEAVGDTAIAFDAYAAALRAGLDGGAGTSELARLDPERAISVLLELNAGRTVGAGARALVEAYLRVGRVAEAGRELIRLALAQDGNHGLLRAASILVPLELLDLLAPQMEDPAASANRDSDLSMAYGFALRRADRSAEALPVLRAVFEHRRSEEVLCEMLRCDPVAARAYIAAHVSDIEKFSSIERIRLLGLLGRRDESIAAFDEYAALNRPTPEFLVALAYAVPDRAISALRRGLDEAHRSDRSDLTSWGVALAQALTATGRVVEAKAAWAEISNRELDLEMLVEKGALR